jgi:hypothetical protein
MATEKLLFAELMILVVFNVDDRHFGTGRGLKLNCKTFDLKVIRQPPLLLE